MLKLYFFSFISFITCFWSKTTLSEIRFPEIPSKNKPLVFDLQKEYFRTHSNYTNLGQYVDLPSRNFFQYMALHPRLSYSPLPYYINFNIFANSFYVTSKTQTATRSVFRPTVLGGGFEAYYKFKKFYTGFEFRGGAPLYNNFFRQSDELIVGDGSYFVEPGFWFFATPSPTFYIYFNTAFRYRFNLALSSLLFNRIGGVLKTQYINAGIGLNSFMAIHTSPEERDNNEVHKLLLSTNAGSYTFFSVQPSALSGTTWLEFKFKPLFTTLYFNLNTIGKNYARGFSFGINTKLKWNTKSSIFKTKKHRFDLDDIDSDTHGDSSYFKEENDPYNKGDVKKELKQEINSLKK